MEFFTHFVVPVKRNPVRTGFWLLLLLALAVWAPPAPAQDPIDSIDVFLPLILKGPGSEDPGTGPIIGPVATNLADYANGQVPRYETPP